MTLRTHGHTPGPWVLGDPGSIYEGHIISTGNKPSRGTLIADMVGSIENETIAADARLIAAAPDLLMVAKIDDAFQRLGYTQAAVAELEAHGITVPLTPPYGLDLAAFQKEVRRAALSKAGAR